jgi:hypothetical protein
MPEIDVRPPTFEPPSPSAAKLIRGCDFMRGMYKR